ncbi:unnamed protein product, partial [Ectocarpus sp. 13 AM-2016]
LNATSEGRRPVKGCHRPESRGTAHATEVWGEHDRLDRNAVPRGVFGSRYNYSELRNLPTVVSSLTIEDLSTMSPSSDSDFTLSWSHNAATNGCPCSILCST